MFHSGDGFGASTKKKTLPELSAELPGAEHLAKL